jgi:4'-phosphopantetheinyl transferase
MSAFAPNAGLGDRGTANAPALREGEVAVWQAPLDDATPEWLQFLHELLSADEAERASRFFFERDRRRFIVGRGVLRLILARYIDVAARELSFVYGANGKPALAGESSQVHFNLAHSGEVALYAVTRTGEVGIDVERVREMADWERIAELSFPLRECARVNAAPPGEKMPAFFRAWTRQEALLKALGVGLGGPRRDFSQFRVHSLPAPAGYAAAVAVSRTARFIGSQIWRAGAVPGQFEARQCRVRQLLKPVFRLQDSSA